MLFALLIFTAWLNDPCTERNQAQSTAEAELCE